MSKVDWASVIDEKPKFHKKFNKEVYCKKNKISGNKYGPHIYINGYCKNCSKIDPQKKKKIGVIEDANCA